MEQISSKKFRKTRRKIITNWINSKLISLDTPLLKYYKNSLGCSEILIQKLDKLTSRYCNSRTCLTCNGIRTAKYINYYGEQIRAFKKPYFITLTAPTIWCINPENLRFEIEKREKSWRKIMQNAHFQGIKLNGVKSLEVVASETKKDYFHPHFHLIIDGKEESEWVLSQWLKHFPGANKKAQMVKPVHSEQGILEVFKYGTKFVLGKKMIEPESLDRIIQSLYRKRLISTFGTVKRIKDDDVNEIVQSVSYDDLEVVFERYWVWFKDIDWIASDTGELFSNYKPSDEFKKMYN